LAVDITAPIDVDWLSGCSMSFRRRVFDRLRFDEGLPGYGLGEDVDLTYRVAQMGRLVVTPAARLQHLQSPTNRLDAVRYTRDELITRARRVRHRTGRLRMRAFWWSVIGQICALVVEREENPGRLSTTVRTALEIARESITSRPRLSPTTQPEPPRV
jgi:GT2 family glycosyltransferase